MDDNEEEEVIEEETEEQAEETEEEQAEEAEEEQVEDAEEEQAEDEQAEETVEEEQAEDAEEEQEDNQNINQGSTTNQGNAANTMFDFYRKEQTLLVQFKNSEETKQIPEKTDLACFWCCHAFENRPCVIPNRDLGTHLQVYGNFCCPECAMAYLFDQRMDAHSRWEQLSLLNRVMVLS